MKKVFALAAVLLIASASNTANAITGYGDMSCGQWLAADVQEKKGKPTLSGKMAISWLSGYLTGMALGNAVHEKDDIDVLKASDLQSGLVWMDKYCAEHPLQTVGTGGVNLYFELWKVAFEQKRAQRK